MTLAAPASCCSCRGGEGHVFSKVLSESIFFLLGACSQLPLNNTCSPLGRWVFGGVQTLLHQYGFRAIDVDRQLQEQLRTTYGEPLGSSVSDPFAKAALLPSSCLWCSHLPLKKPVVGNDHGAKSCGLSHGVAMQCTQYRSSGARELLPSNWAVSSCICKPSQIPSRQPAAPLRRTLPPTWKPLTTKGTARRDQVFPSSPHVWMSGYAVSCDVWGSVKWSMMLEIPRDGTK